MQSDRSSLCGDVVLDNVNMAFTSEDSILDQTYDKHFFYYEDLEFKKVYLRKCISKNKKYTIYIKLNFFNFYVFLYHF